MVFPKIRYNNRSRLCGTSGIASDLVAPGNDSRMENRTHNRNSCSQLDLDPSHDRIHLYIQGVL